MPAPCPDCGVWPTTYIQYHQGKIGYRTRCEYHDDWMGERLTTIDESIKNWEKRVRFRIAIIRERIDGIECDIMESEARRE